jgi:hypothetical protein
LFVVRPVGLFELFLQGVPVVVIISGKQFDDIFDLRSAVIADALAAVRTRETKIFAFNVPVTKELGDIDSVDIKDAGLTRGDMTAPTRRGVAS